MSLTLDATLQTAQDSESHHLRMEIVSSEGVADIPFAGELLSSSTTDETEPALIGHSSGSIITAFLRNPRYIVFGYTDASRLMWDYVTFDLGYGHTCYEVALCELANGNVAILYQEVVSGTRYTRYRIVTQQGVNLDPAVTGTIFSQSSSLYMSGPHAIKLPDDSYLMVYGLYDGVSDYYLYTRTSADFLSWDVATQLDNNPVPVVNRKGNPYLLSVSATRIMLLFDELVSVGPSGEELINIRYQLCDSGAWGLAQSLTTYDSYDVIASHPTAAIDDDDDIWIVFDKVMASLQMADGSLNWEGTNYPASMNWDAINQKLYAVQQNGNYGGGYFGGINQIDFDSWTITDSWTTSSVPPVWTGGHGSGWDRFFGSGQYCLVGGLQGQGFLNLIDGESDTIVQYFFSSMDGNAKNVDWDDTPGIHGTIPSLNTARVVINGEDKRIYCMLQSGYPYDQTVVGYIDIADTGPTYTFVELYRTRDIGSQNNPTIYVFPENDLIVLNWHNAGQLGTNGYLICLTMDGALYKFYKHSTFTQFPSKGLQCVQYYNGFLFGGISYYNSGDDVDRRGLCVINLANDIMTYVRPDYASADDYNLCNACMTEDDMILFCSYGYGIALFDPATVGWVLYTNETVPNLTPGGIDSFYFVDYDPATRMIFASLYNGGIVAFSRDGALYQAQYSTGVFTADVWDGTVPDNLVQGYLDFNTAVAVGGGDLYAVWVSEVGSEDSIKWAKNDNDVDITDYIPIGSPVVIEEHLDVFECQHEKSLSFSIINAYLFDPMNSRSLLRSVLSIGRTLTVKFGERVGGVDYWQNQGKFFITQNPIDYGVMGSLATMKVEAEDKTFTWDQDEITATSYYDAQYPEDIIADILEDIANVDAGDISLGTWTGRTELTHQWIEMTIKDMISQICKRFGYFVRFDVDGKVDARRIMDDASVDHAYMDQNSIRKLSPGKSDNDFINRVIIEGEELDYTEVLTDEERVARINVSHRWNTGNKDYTIWYSDDRSRRCKYPRLEVVDSALSLAFDLTGGVTESLNDNSHSDPDQNMWDKYCTIEVRSDDLTPALAAATAGTITFAVMPDPINEYTNSTIRWGSFLSTLFSYLGLMILGATANLQYEIWAHPVGYVRRKVQSSIVDDDNNDYPFQQRIGRVVTEKDQNPLCYSAGECNSVAAYLMMCHIRGRAPLQLEKGSHLQDEVGDTLSFIHHISGDTIKVFVTDLVRTWTKPSDPQANDGLATDQIEGWAIV